MSPVLSTVPNRLSKALGILTNRGSGDLRRVKVKAFCVTGEVQHAIRRKGPSHVKENRLLYDSCRHLFCERRAGVQGSRQDDPSSSALIHGRRTKWALIGSDRVLVSDYHSSTEVSLLTQKSCPRSPAPTSASSGEEVLKGTPELKENLFPLKDTSMERLSFSPRQRDLQSQISYWNGMSRSVCCLRRFYVGVSILYTHPPDLLTEREVLGLTPRRTRHPEPNPLGFETFGRREFLWWSSKTIDPVLSFLPIGKKSSPVTPVF